MSTAEFSSRGIGESPWSRNILGHMVGEFGATDALLRARRERPSGRTDERDERAPSYHSITSSARASTVVGMSMPSALAVLRLITSSNLVGCSTGRSAGSPFRILSTYAALR